MFEEDRTGIDRAYVAVPVSLEEALQVALRWCLPRADNDYKKLGIRVPSRRLVTATPDLQRLERAGVAISGESRRGVRNIVRGPLIVLSPTLESLCETEDEGTATAIVVTGVDGPSRPDDEASSVTPTFAGVLPWVSAFHPEHLAGISITPKTPILASPVLKQAMKSFTVSINSSTGLTDSRDRSRVTDGLTKLRSAGHAFDPNDLLASALAHNWRGTAAWELQVLAKEINGGARKRIRETYRADIVQEWEQEASKPEA